MLAALFLLTGATFLKAQQTEKLYLSGTGSDDTVSWQFYCTEGMNSGKWTTIPVPSNWELQGFGKYNYGSDKDNVKGREEGLYKYTFNLPAAWRNRQVNIVFEGVMTDAEVKINGKPAGPAHQGAFYAFKYNITSLLLPGENLLEVTVAKHSANASVNAAERKGDFWIFGGIFRPVYLEALPLQHISHLSIDARADGSFTAKVLTEGGADKVSVQLYTLDNKKFGRAFSASSDKSAPGEILVSSRLSGPRLWNPEFPHLYKAVFTLFSRGKPVHTVSQRFGFRTVEVRQRDGIYVNGVKVKMKGVNRHSFRPETGRTMSKKNSIEDVLLMKDMNMNAVRMSHYPPDGHFLDVCDSLGLFVIDELTGWHGHYDTPTGTKLVKEMLQHDVNYPSVILWANGNEGGHNLDLDTLFSVWDIQKRAVIHPWQVFSGFDTQHYRDYNYGIGNYDHGHAIVMPTEFLHGWYDGGHGAGLQDYWEAMWRNPLSAGGFLWDFADGGVVRTDKDGLIDTDKNHAADGIMGPHHEKEGSYYTIKEVWCPVAIEKKELTPQFDGKLTIENRYHYTNTRRCRFSWKLAGWQEKPAGSTATDTRPLSPLPLAVAPLSTLTGLIPSPDIPPLQNGTLQLDLPANWRDFDVLYVTATDLYGRELFTWSFPIVLPGDIAGKTVKKQGERIRVTERGDSLLNIKAGDVELLISRNNGLLRQVRNSRGVIPFNNGPVLQEGVNNFSGFTYRQDADSLVISSVYNRKQSYNVMEWTVYPSGWVKLKVNYFPAEYFTDMVGVNFSFPEDKIKGVEYLGNGPYRVWKNRMKGVRWGVWNKPYNNTETGEAPFIYPEFKGYYSNLYWCRFITDNQPFTVVTDKEDVFLRLFTPAFKTDRWRNYELTFPSGDISFMQGIPGIGSKSVRAENTGPMGRKNIFYDYEKDSDRWLELTLYFDFTGK